MHSHPVRNSLSASRRPWKEPAGLGLLCRLYSSATTTATLFPSFTLAAVKQQHAQREGYKWQKFSLLFRKVFSLGALPTCHWLKIQDGRAIYSYVEYQNKISYSSDMKNICSLTFYSAFMYKLCAFFALLACGVYWSTLPIFRYEKARGPALFLVCCLLTFFKKEQKDS